MRKIVALFHGPASRKIALPIVGFALWLVVFFSGLDLALHYEFTSKGAGTVPKEWPQESRLQRDDGQATLIFIVDAKHPCKQARLSELAALMASSSDRWAAHILFLEPDNTADGAARATLRRAVAQIPGVTVSSGHAGAEARRFGGASSSGVLLYDVDGRLAFRGDLTEMPGKVGDVARNPTSRGMVAEN